MIRLNTIKHYTGTKAEMPSTLPYGDTYQSTDTGEQYKYDQDGLPQVVGRRISETQVDNDFSIGLSVSQTKENTDGAGWASSVYAGNFHSIANSSELIANVVGSKSLAEHTGSGQSYFIVGAENRAYHAGSGNTGGMYAANINTRITGDGVSSHGYVMGANIETRLDAPNASVDFLQGQHLSIQLKDGEVTDTLSIQVIDFDYSGGTISGDFEYLRIEDDTMPSVAGYARAINCISVLPSVFGGSIEAAGLSDSAVTEHADNAAAVAAGLASGTHYRTGDLLKIVH